jgi:hypothetical protein
VRSQALQPVAGVADASDGRVSNVEGDIAESARWNHNILDHRLLLDAVPLGARVLDEPREGTPGDPAYGAA